MMKIRNCLYSCFLITGAYIAISTDVLGLYIVELVKDIDMIVPGTA